MKDLIQLVPILILAVLAVTPPGVAVAGVTTFDYSVDRFQVTGQVNFADDFDDGDIVPWTFGAGTRIDTGAVLSLRSPGVFMPSFWSFVTGSTSSPGIDVSVARLGVPAFEVSAGSGDFSARSIWTTLPTAPAGSIGGFYSMSIHTGGPPIGGECIHPSQPMQALGVSRTFTVAFRDFNSVPPPYVGPTGLAMGLNETVVCVFDPLDLSQNEMDSHAPEAAAVTLPVTGDLILRMDWDDTFGEMTPAFSVDGGATFQTPFAPRSISFTNASFQLLGDPVVVGAAVPALSAPSLIGTIVGLSLVGAFGIARRRRVTQRSLPT